MFRSEITRTIYYIRILEKFESSNAVILRETIGNNPAINRKNCKNIGSKSNRR